MPLNVPTFNFPLIVLKKS